MFSRPSVVVLLILSTTMTMAQSPPPPVTPPTSPQCCAKIVSSDSTEATQVASLVKLDLRGLSVPVGLQCTEITVVGPGCIGGLAVTCEVPRKEWGGLIAINCAKFLA